MGRQDSDYGATDTGAGAVLWPGVAGAATATATSGGPWPVDNRTFGSQELDELCSQRAAEEAAAQSLPPAPLGPHCPAKYDGVLCWPPARAGALAVQQCFEELNGVKYTATGLASRWCFGNGTWSSYSNYTLCLQNVGEAEGPDDIALWPVELRHTLYEVGYALSLVALFFAVLIFVSFKDLHCLRNVIHTNLMCAYILADFTWILSYSIQANQTNSSQCLSLLVLFNYFHLTTFTWMFVEGLYLYILVVETFTRENVRLRCYLLIGWGTPAVFVALWVIVRCVSPAPESQGWPGAEHLLHDCTWMVPHWSDWLFQAPALVILGVNSVFLIVIMWVLITKLRSATSLETQQSRKATKALLVLIPLLGMTYVLTMAAPPDDATGAAVYEAVRAGLLSTQGLSVALLYCFLNAEVRRALHHRWHRWRESRDLAARPCPACAKDWSPRSRTESIRLYCPPTTTGSKRESTASQSTTTTLLGGHQSHQSHHLAVEHTV